MDESGEATIQAELASMRAELASLRLKMDMPAVSHEATAINENERRLQGLAVLFQEVNTELRSRREPEHLYTAALIGALGAVAWGVATIATVQAPGTPLPMWEHPAIVGAGACLLLAVAVWIKVWREHRVHQIFRANQATLVAKLANLAKLDPEDVPSRFTLAGTTGRGYLYSTLVIATSAVTAAAFCVAVWFMKSGA